MENKIWLITVNMGYGHQRTAFPLKDLAEGEIINANNYQGIPKKDCQIWESTRKFYEFISSFYSIPFVGRSIFSLFDKFQRISSFYPERDLSASNFTLRNMYSLFKKGWGRDLIEKLKSKPLPLLSTFFTPAFMAEFFDYPGDIFCIVCDADISRTWVALKPKESKIKYFAPTERVSERLRLYGVKAENIFLTGYPLPLGNIGSQNQEVLKDDLKERLLNLDPKKRYFEKYRTLIEENLGQLPEKSSRPLTILFSVGGAGAQKEIGIKILKNLANQIKEGKIKLILSAGIREKIKDYFCQHIQNLGLNECLVGQEKAKNSFGGIEIIFEKDIKSYFEKFNLALRKTDVLWTKPSELSFYSALGMPILISSPIGSQEEFNMRWLLKSGFGILQEDPDYLSQWFFDWLEKGYLAEAAFQGFIEGEQMGTINIQRLIQEFNR